MNAAILNLGQVSRTTPELAPSPTLHVSFVELKSTKNALNGVTGCIDAKNSEGTTDRRGRSHPFQCTTSSEDWKIVRMAVMDRSVTSRIVAPLIESVTHHAVSARTIRRRL
ncbi:hypothetical protein TNCV_3171451 [Trichonephila clavipes]|nr:hypothetical protein TNCV_3171451 [Trichonephila clavipes]